MNRMSHFRPSRAAQQQISRVKQQQALSRQAREIDQRRLGEKTMAKPITDEPGR